MSWYCYSYTFDLYWWHHYKKKLFIEINKSIERCKACLIALGLTQRNGLVYDETFSLVIKPGTIRLILTLGLSEGWPLWQLHVRNAFPRATFSTSWPNLFLLKEYSLQSTPSSSVPSSFPFLAKLSKPRPYATTNVTCFSCVNTISIWCLGLNVKNLWGFSCLLI